MLFCRNLNGEYMLNFMISNDLTACNTLFQHPSRHKTTWTGQKCINKRTKEIIPLYAQLDYILCKRRSVILVNDSRSYGGATLSSDHKPLVAKMRMNNHILLFKKYSPSNKKYNCNSPG